MSKATQKSLSFQYLVCKLLLWYSDRKGIKTVENFNKENDLSRLKLMKLLFFVSSKKIELLRTFDTFYAMPYGHVESDVYSYMLQGKFDYFSITKDKTIINDEINSLDELVELSEKRLANGTSDLINTAVNLLSEENSDIITYHAHQLVKLSHKWSSWKSVYSSARRQNKYSLPIPSSIIQSELKIYHI